MGMSTVIDGSASVTINDGTILGITRGTAVASTSGVSVDFTGIPSWCKRLTVVFNEVSGSASSNMLIQLGTGSTSYTTSGYLSTGCVNTGSTVNGASSTAGFFMFRDTASNIVSGHMVLTNISGNIWISSHAAKISSTSIINGGGSVTLGAILTAIRITTVNGTDTFDAGSVNIMYEG
jgi:hypothetical protein